MFDFTPGIPAQSWILLSAQAPILCHAAGTPHAKDAYSLSESTARSWDRRTLHAKALRVAGIREHFTQNHRG